MVKKWVLTKFLLMVTLLLWVVIEPLHLSSHDKQHPPSCEICFQLQHQTVDFISSEILLEPVNSGLFIVPVIYHFHISNFAATFHDLRGPPTQLT